eukprot:TRINITY_DN37476_c0_g3_i2.p1 TRINITY_DN37476_c0_g3~~TRINITY_DN37476_c0_g3_i2.p1  ORF type:complete len:1036 (-),score=251.73 TRINITY_DN37476_c0_g3_i2:323-3430(-)
MFSQKTAKFAWFWLFLLFSFCFSRELKILTLLPLTESARYWGLQQQLALSLTDGSLKDGSSLVLEHVESGNFDTALRNVAELVQEDDVIGLLGPTYSSLAELLTVVAGAFSTPIVSGAVTSPTLSDKDSYPMLARTSLSGLLYAQSLIDLFKANEWMRVSLICSDTTFGAGLCDTLKDDLPNEYNIQVASTHYHKSVSEGYSLNEVITDIDSHLNSMIDNDSHIIVYNGVASDSQVVMARARQLGLLNSSTRWLMIDDSCDSSFFNPSDYCGAICTANLIQAMQGTICLKSGQMADDFWLYNVWNPVSNEDSLTNSQKLQSGMDSWADDNLLAPTASTYDVVKLYVKMIEAFCDDGLASEEFSSIDDCYDNLHDNGPRLFEYANKVTFAGASGVVKLDENFDRYGPVRFTDLRYEEMTEVPIWNEFGTWTPAALTDNGKAQLRMDPSQEFIGAMVKAKIDDSAKTFIVASTIFLIVIIGICIALTRALSHNILFRSGVINPQQVILFLVSIGGFIIWSGIECVSVISPNSNRNTLIIRQCSRVVLIGLICIVLSKVYRYAVVTHNKKMRAISFNKLHSFYTMLGCVVALVSVGLLRYIFRSELFEDEVTIQDQEETDQYFTLTKLHYEEFTSSGQFLVGLIDKEIYTFLLSIFAAIFAFRCSYGSTSLANAKVKTAAFSDLKRATWVSSFIGVVCFVRCLVETLQFFSDQSTDSNVATLGFDNKSSGTISVSKIDTMLLIRFVGDLCIGFLFVDLVFIAKFWRFVQPRFFTTTTRSTSTANSKTRHGRYGRYYPSEQQHHWSHANRRSTNNNNQTDLGSSTVGSSFTPAGIETESGSHELVAGKDYSSHQAAKRGVSFASMTQPGPSSQATTVVSIISQTGDDKSFSKKTLVSPAQRSSSNEVRTLPSKKSFFSTPEDSIAPLRTFNTGFLVTAGTQDSQPEMQEIQTHDHAKFNKSLKKKSKLELVNLVAKFQKQISRLNSQFVQFQDRLKDLNKEIVAAEEDLAVANVRLRRELKKHSKTGKSSTNNQVGQEL